MLLKLSAILLLASIPFFVQEPTPKSTVPLAAGLSFADPMTIKAPHDFLRGFPARTGERTVNAVVEIPCGTNEKWEVKLDGVLRWDVKNNAPRVVEYLGYPANYGIVPQALFGKDIGGDGDPLDVLVLGPAMPRGTVASVRVIGIIRLVEKGEQDHKLIAVDEHGPLGKVDSMSDLERDHVGVTDILKTWFLNYKGKEGTMKYDSFGSRADALELLAKCEAAYAAAEKAKK